MYVVLGANGRAGGETARALVDMGMPVRVVLRQPGQGEKWAGLGADVAIGAVEDEASLVSAMKGASGVFVLSPPPAEGDPYMRGEKTGAALARAVRRAGVPRVVALSSIGAQHREGTGIIAMLNSLERQLEGAAPSIAFLRPGYFIETWEEVAQSAIADGVLPSFLEPAQKIPMVSTMDVGNAAASLLVSAFSGRRIVELRGPQDWSANDVAAAFATVLGRSVAAAFVPREARTAILVQEGVAPEVAEALCGMYDGLASGRVAAEKGNEERRGSVSLVEAVERIVRRSGKEAGGVAA